MVSIMREHFHPANVGPVYFSVVCIILIHSLHLRQGRTREKYSADPVLNHAFRH